jgi:protein-disulfide isomerase
MTRLCRAVLVLALIAGALPWNSPARADGFTPEQRAEIIAIIRDALKQDPSILRDAVNAMQADDSAKTQATTRAAIAKMQDQLVTAADPVAGNPHGDVTIVEFFDTRCPYCRKLEPVMAQFLAEDGNVRVVYKDLPILGPASVLGTKALLAAQKQNGYEKLRDLVMKMPPDTTLPQIEAAAKQSGLDWDRLSQDMNDPSVQARIDDNLKLARALEIQGTPALVIGKDLIPGAVDLNDLRDAVATARKG